MENQLQFVGVCTLCMSLPSYTAKLWYLSHFIYFIFRELSFMYHRFWKGTILICVFIYNRMNWSEQVSEEAFTLKYNLLQLFVILWMIRMTRFLQANALNGVYIHKSFVNGDKSSWDIRYLFLKDKCLSNILLKFRHTFIIVY